MSLLLVEDAAAGLKIVTLNRPEKMNALSKALIDELIEMARELHKLARTHAIRSVAFRSSSEKAFCAGADLTERMAMGEGGVGEILAKQRELMDGIASISVPTMAVIEGVAFGGGLELALACDFRFCSPSALMGLVETRHAIIPGAGGTQRLPRLIGVNRAKELIFLGSKVSGAAAAEMGLVNKCADNPMQIAHAWAREIAAGGPVGVAAAKLAIDEGAALELPKALDVERAHYETVIHTEDRLEGLRAFAEKRTPRYKGK